MISTGNDIVSLKSARSDRFAQKDYYSKILSPNEEDYFRRRLADKLSFIHYVWLLWSIKEAAYKYLKRADNDLLFNPLKITMENIGLQEAHHPLTVNRLPIEDIGFKDGKFIGGLVSDQNNSICTRSLVAEDFIFSVVSDKNVLDKTYWGIEQINSGDYTTQSEAVRQFAVHKLKDTFPCQDFTIEKNEAGVPGIVCGSKLHPVSFAHHERYIAYSFVLQPAE